MSSTIETLNFKVDEWITAYLPFFCNENLSTESYIKLNSELVFYVIFTKKSDDHIYNSIIKFIDFFEKDKHLFNNSEYAQTRYLLKIFKKNFAYSTKIDQIRNFDNDNLDFYKNYIDIAEIEILCYKNILLNTDENFILHKYLNCSAYNNMFKVIPSITDIYMHTHCVFYLSHLNNDNLNVLESHDLDRVKYYNSCLLSYAIKITHYDLIGELLICYYLLEPSKNIFQNQLFFVGINILEQFVDSITKEKNQNIEFFKDNYHTILVIAILTSIMKKNN